MPIPLRLVNTRIGRDLSMDGSADNRTDIVNFDKGGNHDTQARDPQTDGPTAPSLRPPAEGSPGQAPGGDG